MQDSRYQGDAWDEAISAYIEEKSAVTYDQIFDSVLKIDLNLRDQRSRLRIGKIMRRLGWDYMIECVDASCSVCETAAKCVLLGKISSHLPSRIPIGFSGKSINASKGILPFEISLGIISKARPKKRFWWGPIGNIKTKNSLVIGVLKDIYGEYAKEKIFIRIYNDSNDEYRELVLKYEEIQAMNFRIDFQSEILKEINKYGMYTVFSDYPGFFVYSLTENQSGSIAIEHGF